MDKKIIKLGEHSLEMRVQALETMIKNHGNLLGLFDQYMLMLKSFCDQLQINKPITKDISKKEDIQDKQDRPN